MSAKGKCKAWIIFKLAAYGLAGLVTTLGIAWVQPFAGPVRYFVSKSYHTWYELLSTRTSDRYESFIYKVGDSRTVQIGLPKHPASFAEGLRTAVYIDRTGILMSGTGPSPGLWIADFRGFPFRCTWAWEWRDSTDEQGPIGEHSHLELPLFVDPRTMRGLLLPVTPVWPGLIADTAIWGLAWYALLFLPLRIRRWMRASRARRGLCTACGYNLTGIQGRCPECGEEISMGGKKATIAK